MPQFAIGDRVKVTNDTEGQPDDLIDATGTIVAIGSFLERGTVGFPPHKEQEYDVDFDELGLQQGIWESWLLSESN